MPPHLAAKSPPAAEAGKSPQPDPVPEKKRKEKEHKPKEKKVKDKQQKHRHKEKKSKEPTSEHATAFASRVTKSSVGSEDPGEDLAGAERSVSRGEAPPVSPVDDAEAREIEKREERGESLRRDSRSLSRRRSRSRRRSPRGREYSREPCREARDSREPHRPEPAGDRRPHHRASSLEGRRTILSGTARGRWARERPSEREAGTLLRLDQTPSVRQSDLERVDEKASTCCCSSSSCSGKSACPTSSSPQRSCRVLGREVRQRRGC